MDLLGAMARGLLPSPGDQAASRHRVNPHGDSDLPLCRWPSRSLWSGLVFILVRSRQIPAKQAHSSCRRQHPEIPRARLGHHRALAPFRMVLAGMTPRVHRTYSCHEGYPLLPIPLMADPAAVAALRVARETLHSGHQAAAGLAR